MPCQFNLGQTAGVAVISEEFTFENVRKVAQAIAEKTLADVRHRSAQRYRR